MAPRKDSNVSPEFFRQLGFKGGETGKPIRKREMPMPYVNEEMKNESQKLAFGYELLSSEEEEYGG